MKDRLQFFVPIENPPRVTHQQKQVTIRNGKPIFYEPDRLKEARAQFTNWFGQHVPEKPFKNVPLHCTIKWFYPTENKQIKDGQWKQTAPDLDNLSKLPLDVMEELGFWKNDGLIASKTVQKFWVKDSLPGIFVRIEVLQ